MPEPAGAMEPQPEVESGPGDELPNLPPTPAVDDSEDALGAAAPVWDASETGGAYWCRTGLLLFLHAFIVVGFGLAFTEMGYGATVYKALAEVHHVSSYVLMGAGGAAAFLYVYDIGYWHGCMYYVKVLCYLLLLAAVGAGAVLSFQTHPYLPLGVVLLFVPGYYLALRDLFFYRCHLANYMSSVGAVNVIGGIACLVTAIIWASHHDYWWGDATKISFKARLIVPEDPWNSACLSNCGADQLLVAEGCNSTVCHHDWHKPSCLTKPGVKTAAGKWDELPSYDWKNCQSLACQQLLVQDKSYHCLPAFLLYASQFIAAIFTIVFGLVVVLLGRSIRHTAEHPEAMNPVIKIFFIMFSIGFLVIWCAASIAGASMRMANLVMAMAAVLLLVTVVMMGTTVGWKALAEDVDKIPLVSSLDGLKQSNLVKSAMMLFAGPIIPFYFVVSFLNQVGRRCLPFTKTLTNEPTTDFDEREIWITSVGRQQLDAMRAWNWTEVLGGMVFISNLYFGLSVGAGRVTVMVLSWLNSALAGIPLAAVTAIYVGVGLIMFLLPPVPGVPVYLTGGIILTAASEKSFRPVDDPCNAADDPCQGGMSADASYFWMGVAYASTFAFLTKLLAIAMQQKAIGGVLGAKVSVRSMVGVNSTTIRTIRLILKDPRPLTLGKVCILVGGPDWPTSVLTGVLGISLLPMIIGSLPVLFPLALTTAAGSMLLKASDPDFSSLGGFTLTLATCAQFLSAVAALMVIETTMKNRTAEIEPTPENPLDEEVAKHEAVAEKAAKIKKQATEWAQVPCHMRLLLIAAALSAQLATLLFAFMGSRCLESVEVTTDLDAEPFNGDWLKVVKEPLGWIALGAQLGAILLQYLFGKWSQHATALRTAQLEEEEATAASGPGADDDAQRAAKVQERLAHLQEGAEP